jgi:PAS domain S-box-containing protein
MNQPLASTLSAQPHRLPQRRVIVFIVLLVLAALAALAWKTIDDREKERTIASGALQLQSQALASVFDAAFGLAEQTLLNLSGQMQSLQIRGTGIDQPGLRDQLLHSPFLQDLRIYQSDGSLLARAGLTPLASSQLPDWLTRSQAQGRRSGLGGAPDELAIFQTVQADNGQVHGTLMATFASAYFQGVTEQMPGADIEASLLLGADNQVLLDVAASANPADRAATQQLAQHIAALGPGQGARLLEIGSKLVAIAQLRSQPIRLVQTVSTEVALARWSAQLMQSAVIAAVLVLAAALFLLHWLRSAQAQQRLLADLHLISLAIEQTPASVVITDMDGRILYTNPSFSSATGYTQDEARGQNPRVLQSGTTPKATYQEMWGNLTHGLPWTGLLLNRRKDGSTFWEQSVIMPLRDMAGRATHYFAVKIDMSQRIKAEASVRALLDEQQRLLKAIPVGVYKYRVCASGQDQFDYVSERLCQDLGLPAADLLRDPSLAFASFEPADLDRLQAATATALATDGHLMFEGRLNGDAASPRWLRLESVLTRQDNGDMVWDGIQSDITARKQAQAVQEKAGELLRSNAELEQFSYSISHDLRQPLRMVSSYLQLLQKGLGDTLDAEKREYFNFAIDGARRMDAMMLGLLDYSRVGRKGEPPVWLESRAVLDEALLFLRPLITEAQAELHLEGDWPRVLASPDELLRLLQNLIGNALKFRVAGRQPQITIISTTATTTVGATGGEWQVCISDNGVGMAPDQIGRLFQVFARLQSRSAYEGTGIGLALCRKIAEHHGGSIRAESPGEGQGSRLTLSLPLPQEEKHP